MQQTIQLLTDLLEEGKSFLTSTTEEKLAFKPAPTKWSKKEILGHLIDSGNNNLKRFTEIQFEEKPYIVKKYKQDELVIANRYHEAETEELLGFWLAINKRIVQIMAAQTEETLAYQIYVEDNENTDLRFLMVDYVKHLEYHLFQIMDSTKKSNWQMWT